MSKMIQSLLKRQHQGRQFSCVNWEGHIRSSGYPGNTSCAALGIRSESAHRIAYRMYKGPIPQNMEVDHLCCNPLCINPLHLDIKTRKDNVCRSWGTFAGRKIRQTYCVHGHEFSQENTYIKKNGTRICRSCNRQRKRERWMNRTPEQKMLARIQRRKWEIAHMEERRIYMREWALQRKKEHP